MSKQITVLIFQGGGALGAYQAGVYQQLQQHGIAVDWVVGTSIGAINAALIAGNPPLVRQARIREFWDSLIQKPGYGEQIWAQFLPAYREAWNIMRPMMNGVEGFFKPRLGRHWDINAKVPLAENGFYDTAPLKATLEKYIDFDYLNQGQIRLSVCAVDLDSGQSKVFDSTQDTICAEHIMASGALPPGFPPIKIGGRMYWDGGIYSNSPLEVFLADGENHDALCFMVDLWDPSEARPDSLAQALGRYKSIQYASRSSEQLEMRRKMRDLQRAIRVLGETLTSAQREDMQHLLKLGCNHTINVVHMVMKAEPSDHYFRDVDFSAETMQRRWQSGLADASRALEHRAWLRPLPPHAGLVVHELPQA